MRVPVLVVILLVSAVTGGTWWWNTRNIDFLTPPSDATLEEIRIRVESSFPRADEIEEPKEVVRQPPPPPPEPEPEPLDLGDLSVPPALQEYGVRAPEGSGKMIELAQALEEKGVFPRALLAWERVLDMTQPDDAQRATAIASIQRLRPTLPDWNSQPEAAITITLQAGTGRQTAKDLKPILAEVAKELELATSGIVTVKPVVTEGKTSARGASPVAIWLAGAEKKSNATEVLSFTATSKDAIRPELYKNIFILIRSHLERSTAYTPPAPLAEGEDAKVALGSRVTRLCWSDFATALNLEPVKKK